MRKLIAIIGFIVISIVVFGIGIYNYNSTNTNTTKIVEDENLNYYEKNIDSLLGTVEEHIELHDNTEISQFILEYDDKGFIERLYIEMHSNEYSRKQRSLYILSYSKGKWQINNSIVDIADQTDSNVSPSRDYDNVINILANMELREVTKETSYTNYKIMYIGQESFGTDIKHTYIVDDEFIITDVSLAKMPVEGIGVQLESIESVNNVETNEVTETVKEDSDKEKRYYIYIGTNLFLD